MPGTTHRDTVLESLPAEQRPIADQLVAGGLPAVRRALAAARERPEGGPGDTSNHGAIIALAEQMLPAIKEALWLDRAEAAIATLEHLSLRELRATVLGATPRDEHGRDLDRRLREALEQRVTRLRESWHADMGRALDDGRVLQALRLSGRPPEPSARFPAELVTRLAESAGAAMTSDTPPERWTALLEAAALSPIRRHVKPAGIPTNPDEQLLKLARQAAGRLPALAGLLGMAMPPPPGPTGPVRHVPPPRPPRPPRAQATEPVAEAPAAAGEAPAQATPAAAETSGPDPVSPEEVREAVHQL